MPTFARAMCGQLSGCHTHRVAGIWDGTLMWSSENCKALKKSCVAQQNLKKALCKMDDIGRLNKKMTVYFFSFLFSSCCNLHYSMKCSDLGEFIRSVYVGGQLQ